MSKPYEGDRRAARAGRPEGRLDELSASRRRLVLAADMDRRAIERAMHDGLQQELTALALYLQRARALLDTDSAGAQALLEDAATLVRDAVNDAAGLAQRIYPALLDARGLAGPLHALADRSGAILSIDVGSPGKYSPEITHALYWTCSLVLSWAPPGAAVTVEIHEADGTAAFTIATDCPLTPGQIVQLRDRVAALGGELEADLSATSAVLSGCLPLSDRQALSARQRRPRPGT